MGRTNSRLIKRFCVVTTALFAMCVWSSCSKDVMDNLLQQDMTNNTMAVVSYYNAVSGSLSGKVFLDQKLQNSGSEQFKYGDYLSYQTALSGERMLSADMLLSNRKNISYEKMYVFQQGINYSVFFYNKGGDDIDVLVHKDDLIMPKDEDIVKVRFANFGELSISNISESSSRSTIFNNIGVNQVSDFVEIDLKSYEFEVVAAGQKIKPAKIKFNPTKKGIYTIWIQETKDSAGSSGELSYSIVSYP